MYGCSNNSFKSQDRLKERIFPLLYSQQHSSFSFQDCSFAVQKCRESTARVVLWKEFDVLNSFTLECSFCGPTQGMYKDCHFTPRTLKDLGKGFCETMVIFQLNREARQRAFRELEIRYPRQTEQNQLTQSSVVAPTDGNDIASDSGESGEDDSDLLKKGKGGADKKKKKAKKQRSGIRPTPELKVQTQGSNVSVSSSHNASPNVTHGFSIFKTESAGGTSSAVGETYLKPIQEAKKGKTKTKKGKKKGTSAHAIAKDTMFVRAELNQAFKNMSGIVNSLTGVTGSGQSSSDTEVVKLALPLVKVDKLNQRIGTGMSSGKRKTESAESKVVIRGGKSRD